MTTTDNEPVAEIATQALGQVFCARLEIEKAECRTSAASLLARQVTLPGLVKWLTSVTRLSDDSLRVGTTWSRLFRHVRIFILLREVDKLSLPSSKKPVGRLETKPTDFVLDLAPIYSV